MKKVYALIPARSGSKGLPDKNIMKLNDHPLLGWSIAAAKNCKLIDRVIVSTDSKEYADIALSYGAEVPFIRPIKLSSDTSSDFDFVDHALNFFKEECEEPHFIAHLRPTTPLRDPALMDKAIKLIKQEKNCTSLRSVHEMSETAYKSLEIDDSKYLKSIGLMNHQQLDNNAPRQSFPKTFQPNGYIDILISSHVRKYSNIHGQKTIPFITEQAAEVDCAEDFKYLEYSLNSNKTLNKIFNQ